MSAAIPLVQPVPLRFLLDDTIVEARRWFRAIYPGVAVPMAAAAALVPFGQRFIQSGPGGARRASLPGALEGFLGFLAVMVAFLVVYTVCYVAMLAAAGDAHHGRGVSLARAWAFALRPAVVGTVALALGAATLATGCCILPGIYVSLVFALTGPVMLEEARFGTGALGRSAALMQYNPKGDFAADPRVKLFLIVFVGMLLSYAANFVVQVPFIVFQQVILFRDIANGRQPDPAALMERFLWLQVLLQFLGGLINAAINLFVAFGITRLFVDLRARKEGPDLEAAIGSLAAGPRALAP